MFLLKYLLVPVVGVLLVLLVQLTVRTFERQIALCFKRGFARHRTIIKQEGHEGETEVLSFAFQHLHFRQVLFLALCWIIRIAEPDTSLYDLRFPTRASERENDAEDVGTVVKVGLVA